MLTGIESKQYHKQHGPLLKTAWNAMNVHIRGVAAKTEGRRKQKGDGRNAPEEQPVLMPWFLHASDGNSPPNQCHASQMLMWTSPESVAVSAYAKMR